jgi:CDP-glucose 4,6-dehydratase
MTDSGRALTDMRVLVTGGTGIVGGWLVPRLLERGADVVVLVRDEPAGAQLYRSGDVNRVTRVRGGLEDERLLGRILADYEVRLVIHLGAQTQVVTAMHDPLGTLESNVRGTYNLLEAARRQIRPPALVIASSDKAYGTSDTPLAGRGIYDVSKTAADLIATAYAQSYALPVVIARCGNIYGGGDLNWERIVPGTIRALLAGQRPVLRSDGSPRRDYLYVEDAVNAYMRLAEVVLSGRQAGEAFNFGHNKPVSVVEIVDELRNILGRRDLEPVILGSASMEIPDQYLDASKAARVLDWRPAFGLHEGLMHTVEWYRDLGAA